MLLPDLQVRELMPHFTLILRIPLLFSDSAHIIKKHSDPLISKNFRKRTNFSVNRSERFFKSKFFLFH